MASSDRRSSGGGRRWVAAIAVVALAIVGIAVAQEVVRNNGPAQPAASTAVPGGAAPQLAARTPGDRIEGRPGEGRPPEGGRLAQNDAPSRPGGGPPGGGPPGGGPPMAVSIEVAEEMAITETVPVFGRLVPREMGVVAALARGAVGEMRVEVGDRVEKGAPIAVLLTNRLRAERDLKAAELLEYRARVETARAQVGLAEQELARLERLRGSAAFPAARFDDKGQEVLRVKSALGEAEARVVQAQATLRAVEIDLADAVIRAPFPGVVSQRHTQVGAYLTVGAPVVTLINDRALEIEAEVPSVRLAGLGEGTVIEAALETGAVAFHAAVRAVVPEENPMARTRTVRFVTDLDGLGVNPAANQSVILHIPLGAARDAVMVHKDAVIYRDGRPSVFVIVEGDRAAIRTVEIGEAAGERFEIRSGLSRGERVVVRGNERLQPGQRVEARTVGAS